MMIFVKGGLFQVTVGEKIHYLRTKNNMTMDDLARELGVQRSAINKYEKGIVVNLKRSTISGLCRVFGVSSSYFLDDAEPVSNEEPKNDDIRLLVRGLNQLTPEQVEQAKNVMKAMFSKYADFFDKGE